jgi:hypothetical protein
MTLRVRMVMTRVRIMVLSSKPLCEFACRVMTLHLPGVTRYKPSLKRRKKSQRKSRIVTRRKVRLTKLVTAMAVISLTHLLMTPSQGG